MTSPALPSFRVLACRRGSTLIGYSSLTLLGAIAAIALLGYPETEAGGAPHHRVIGTISSD